MLEKEKEEKKEKERRKDTVEYGMLELIRGC